MEYSSSSIHAVSTGFLSLSLSFSLSLYIYISIPITLPYHLLPQADPKDYISCPHRAVVSFCKSACPSEEVHWRMSRMNSSLLLQQCPACLVRHIWIVLEMGVRWPYCCCFVGCCFRDLFNIVRSILVQFPASFFSLCFVSVHIVNLSSDINRATAWKKSRFILSGRSDFRIIDISPRHH